jgi:hypothetical protein
MQPDPDRASNEDQTDPQRADRLEFPITPRILGGRRPPGNLPRSQGDKVLRRRKTSSARQLGYSLIYNSRMEWSSGHADSRLANRKDYDQPRRARKPNSCIFPRPPWSSSTRRYLPGLQSSVVVHHRATVKEELDTLSAPYISRRDQRRYVPNKVIRLPLSFFSPVNAAMISPAPSEWSW